MKNINEEKILTTRELRAKQAEKIVINAFEKAGWKVDIFNHAMNQCPDIIVNRSGVTYVIEIKMSAEGRKDRLIPLWSQIFLESSCLAGRNKRPLAIVAAPKIAPSVAKQILDFATKYAPDAAVGVVDLAGLRMFSGPHLEELNFMKENEVYNTEIRPMIHSPTNLFSDLNQWMLKVLLAPKIPNELLWAPRKSYRSASELAKAANVSRMSASRLVQQLRQEGYLHESAPHLKLVRRKSLFQRWQSAAETTVKELPLRFIFRSDPLKELKKMSQSDELCLGLFAAADALNFGFVRGVPPYAYVPQLNLLDLSKWKNIIPASSSDSPDIILRQPAACQSVFRGMVKADDLNVCDIIQIWLDVSSHPSRGQEQGNLIQERVLTPLIYGENGNE